MLNISEEFTPHKPLGSWHRLYESIVLDQNFMQLSDSGKLLFYYFIAPPHGNSIGVYHIPLRHIYTNLAWTKRRFDSAFFELSGHGDSISPKKLKNCNHGELDTANKSKNNFHGVHKFVSYDVTVNVIRVNNFLIYNTICNQNSLKRAVSDISKIPDTPLLDDVILKLIDINNKFHTPIKGLSELLAQRLSLPLPIPLSVRLGEHNIESRSRSRNKEKIQKENSSCSESKKIKPTTEQLQKCFNAYPKNASPKESIKKISLAIIEISRARKINIDQAADWLLERVQRYADSPLIQRRKKEGAEKNNSALSFVPSCSVWINQGRYDEDDSVWEYPTATPCAEIVTMFDISQEFKDITLQCLNTMRERTSLREIEEHFPNGTFGVVEFTQDITTQRPNVVCVAKDENFDAINRNYKPLIAGIISDIKQQETAVKIIPFSKYERQNTHE